MMLKIRFSKALPERALSYAINKDIQDRPIRRNLFSDKDALIEMKETAEKFGKWTDANQRKTLSLIISPNPKDNPTEEQVLEVTEAILDKFFPTVQGIIVLHRDKGMDSKKSSPVLHAHFYGSIIDPVTGNNIHLSDKDVSEIRKWSDEYAEKHFGWKQLERNEKQSGKRHGRLMMRKMMEQGRESWMLNLTSDIEEAYNSAYSFADFEKRLQRKGIHIMQRKGSSQLKFSVDIGGRIVTVNGSTISDLLSLDNLVKKFNEIKITEDKHDGSKRLCQRNTQEIKLGKDLSKGTHSYSGTRTHSGTRSIGSNGRKINYGCIFCTKDKEICSRCSEFKKGKGGYSHGSRVR